MRLGEVSPPQPASVPKTQADEVLHPLCGKSLALPSQWQDLSGALVAAITGPNPGAAHSARWVWLQQLQKPFAGGSYQRRLSGEVVAQFIHDSVEQIHL